MAQVDELEAQPAARKYDEQKVWRDTSVPTRPHALRFHVDNVNHLLGTYIQILVSSQWGPLQLIPSFEFGHIKLSGMYRAVIFEQPNVMLDVLGAST